MPVLNDNVKHNSLDGRVIDKESEDIAYFDSTHEYVDKKDGRKGISVTTLVHNYTQPFDEVFWSSYKAMEALLEPEAFYLLKCKLLNTKKFDPAYIDEYKIKRSDFVAKQQEILAEYDRKRTESCEHGTKVHAAIENALYGRDVTTFKKFGIGGSLPVYKGDYRIQLESGVYPEYLISYRDDDFLLCGQVDLIWVDGNHFCILDHKTNNKIEKKSYYNKFTKQSVKMKYPLNDLDDVNYWHYVMQLSIYAWMIKQHMPNLILDKLIIHWIDHENKESFLDVPYLEKEVIMLIKHYKKHSKMREALDRNKSVI